ncbi:hypothetical protein [Sphingomonas sp. 1P08PE]|uniref:hypothetical protein n=1 Tax=Sphingomonas sp. 1P08PE TaxID=554122 RepID=UPI0039A1B96F
MTLFRPLLIVLVWLVAALPAQAAVTATFWSHELGNSFPHAFFTLRGTPDAGGPAVDLAYGFTARTLSPAILWGTVAGRLEAVKPSYIGGSDAQFAVVLTDAQYASLLALARGWSEEGGDNSYNLNRRNCVHFVQEAARRIGLTGLDQPKLMKKPRSYLKAVTIANQGRVIALGIPGKAYLSTLPPLPSVPAASR